MLGLLSSYYISANIEEFFPLELINKVPSLFSFIFANKDDFDYFKDKLGHKFESSFTLFCFSSSSSANRLRLGF